MDTTQGAGEVPKEEEEDDGEDLDKMIELGGGLKRVGKELSC